MHVIEEAHPIRRPEAASHGLCAGLYAHEVVADRAASLINQPSSAAQVPSGSMHVTDNESQDALI